MNILLVSLSTPQIRTPLVNNEQPVGLSNNTALLPVRTYRAVLFHLSAHPAMLNKNLYLLGTRLGYCNIQQDILKYL